DMFLTAALDLKQTPAARVRAIEILTELFSGLSAEAAATLSKTAADEVRARTAWSLGVKPIAGLDPDVLIAFLTDADPLVCRRALESIPTAGVNPYPLMPAVAQCMN